jgi:sulfatase modifying factor 1
MNASIPSPVEGALPVTDVSWVDAVGFCNALSALEGLPPAYLIEHDCDEPEVRWDKSSSGYRLPTEAEWEYACKAGTAGPHYAPLDAIAWYRANSDERIHPIGGKEPNSWGLYDMIGNTWEWCWDQLDPIRYRTYRTFKGGGWFDPAWSCRASVRRGSFTHFQSDDLGFRLARNVPHP